MEVRGTHFRQPFAVIKDGMLGRAVFLEEAEEGKTPKAARGLSAGAVGRVSGGLLCVAKSGPKLHMPVIGFHWRKILSCATDTHLSGEWEIYTRMELPMQRVLPPPCRHRARSLQAAGAIRTGAASQISLFLKTMTIYTSGASSPCRFGIIRSESVAYLPSPKVPAAFAALAGGVHLHYICHEKGAQADGKRSKRASGSPA